jgi:hypothetical protein
MHDIDLMLKLQIEGKNKEARAISDKLEKLGPDKVLDMNGKATQDIWFRHCFNRGWFLIQDGDYQAGCRLLEHGRFLNVYGSPPLRTDAPIYNPETHTLKGKSIIISLEGGYGDEIIHSRFATTYKELGAEKVYIATVPEMISVFSRIKGVDKVIARNQTHLVQHDFWIPGFSAGWIAGHTFDKFPNDPYLTPRPETVDIWKTIIKSDKIKVGIRWAGNPKFEHQQFRRFPENFITNLAKYPELQVYSLQRDHNTIQLPEGITDLQHLLISWEDTMGAIANLDLVITSCTSIAHLAGAMGKEVWVLVPVLPYHTWTPGSPNSESSPYYKTVRVFRQKIFEKWNEPFQKIYKELEEKYKLAHIDLPNEDKEKKRINLGCGLKKFKNFLNVDKYAVVNPDQVVDLEQFPWPWKDSEFDHIVAKDILEHLGATGDDFIKVIKEMYRISGNGAIWEIVVPHWRCDTALDDPTHKRAITVGMFHLFNKRNLIQKAQNGDTESLLGFEHDIDIEVCDIQFEYTAPYEARMKQGKITQEELDYSINHLNNVALATRILIQVHKAGRYDHKDLEAVIAAREEDAKS